MTARLTVTDAPSAEAVAAIESGLSRYNEEQAGYSDSRPLAVLVRAPDSEAVVGGILGRSSLGLCFIDLVFLPEALRGSGLGSAMMRQAEDEARRRRCRAVVLYTISFQAPEFYERLGYRCFGTIACDPPGTSRVFMTKELA